MWRGHEAPRHDVANAGLAIEVCDRVNREPEIAPVRGGRGGGARVQADGVVGLGGGSPSTWRSWSPRCSTAGSA